MKTLRTLDFFSNDGYVGKTLGDDGGVKQCHEMLRDIGQHWEYSKGC